MKKTLLIGLVLVLIFGVGCTPEEKVSEELPNEEVIEENEQTEGAEEIEVTIEKVETEVEIEEVEEKEEELDFSKHTINDKQIKITHPEIPVDDIINVLTMNTNEFVDTFGFEDFENKSYPNVGTIGGSYYFIVEDTVFYLSFSTIYESYDKKSVLTIDSQYNSKNAMVIEVNGLETISHSNTAEEVKNVLGVPNSEGEAYDEYGEEKEGNTLVYKIKGLTENTYSTDVGEDIFLVILTDTETNKIISFSVY
jgi:predicted regulator of Ras-like GTPase activity (Roadblock/LC7/MglB family)